MVKNKISFLICSCLLVFHFSWAAAVSLEQSNGMQLGSQGMFDEARIEFVKALTNDKHDSTSLSALGLLNDLKANKVSKECLVILFKGLILLNQNQTELAISEFQAAVKISPNYAKIYNILGMVYTAKGQAQEAEIELKKAIELDPEYSLAYFNLGLFYQSQNRIPEAVAFYEKAVEFDPSLLDALMNCGYIYAEKGEYPQAVNFFKKAIKIDSQNPDIYYNLGMTYFMMDQYLKSRENFLKAKNLFSLRGNQEGIEKTDRFLNKFFELEGKWKAAK